ncbi:MAG TPA: M3 family oligoendopeptidase [Gemmatimonadales bacterium]|nr:M3 family oligoendopeptidase [Gemmatimonadales bacterium]
MMKEHNVLTMPSTPAELAGVEWNAVAGWYEQLAEAPLNLESRDAWLEAWSRLEELLTEAASRAMIAYTLDTSDLQKEAAHLRFSTEIMPRADEQSVRLARRLLDSGLSRDDLGTTLQRFRTASEIFREENVPRFAELEELGARYQRITGGMTAAWNGEELPLPRLQPFLKSRDRDIRERAFRLLTAPYMAERDAMAGLFDEMYRRRQEVAASAGFANFRDYVFPAKFRFDYTPADCERFHTAIEETVVPAVGRALDRRRERLGLASLRPWDLQVDPYAEPSRPFTTGAELADRALTVFERVDPALGGRFRTMIDEGLLDLESRHNKAPGGYCDTLQFSGRPFIFMNAAGIPEDVMTLLHEAGHAFHAFEADRQPLIWQRHPGSEVAELASMSMELLASPYLSDAGFYSRVEAESAELEHLEDVLITLAHIASVDAFQTWIYTSGEGGSAAARDAAWLRIRGRFERGVDWTGLEAERVARWYRQLHIFLYPFYYIEYGIAQVGALQVWRNAQRNQAEAVRRYREALALGATRPLPALFDAAGVRFTFDARDIGALVSLVEERMETLRAGLPAAA